MSDTRQSKFVPLAKHAFDISSLRQTQKAVNALLNARVVQGTGNGFIHLADGSTVYELPAQDVTPIFPFKIYNTTNSTLTSAQVAEFSAQGSSPDTYCFQIRNGVLSGRPYLGVNANFLEGFFGNLPIQGNFEVTSEIGTDTFFQPGGGSYVEDFLYPETPNTGTGTILPSDGTPGLIVGTPKGSPAGTLATVNSQVFSNPMLDDNGTSSAGYWIEIVDDPLNYFYLNLMGQMWAGDIIDSTGRGVYPFPTGPNIIPLGVSIITTLNQRQTYVENLQFGNLINRYSGNGYYRGKWNEIFAAVPASATAGGLIFYPGDIVEDDSAVINIGGSNCHGVFIYTATNYNALLVTANPQTYGGDWKMIGLTQ